MSVFKIKKGLNLPIKGSPSKERTKLETKKVAILGPDFVGMKPSMKVKIGDKVKIGQVLFECKKNEGLKFTSPASGEVVEINRGERRVFQSLVISVDGKEYESFKSFKSSAYEKLSVDEIKELIQESGLWSSFRTRPFSKSAPLNLKPSAIFITAIDTNPLAIDPQDFISEYQVAFNDGVKIISRLTDGLTHVCRHQSSSFDVPKAENIKVSDFSGKHPAGNVGTHIHLLEPVGPNKSVWHIGYQDVVAVGKLFGSGRLFTERWVSLCGPQARNPRTVVTNMGANLVELTDSEQKEGENRIVSGSLFSGRKVNNTAFAYLGRFHNQVTILREDRHRELLGWHAPGFEKFSVMRTFLSKLNPSKVFKLGTSTNGSLRAIVPVGAYEKVMPLDILPTQLLRALISMDSDSAQALGCLELDEEDLALCTFVDPGKQDFGPLLRENLTKIEKEG